MNLISGVFRNLINELQPAEGKLSNDLEPGGPYAVLLA
jgi:hypothetical protein